MRTRLKTGQKMTIVLLITLFFLLQTSTGSSALAASQAATDKPISGKATTTVPAGKVAPEQTTTTAPLPSTAPAREYQQVDKPPAKKVDIPEYDLAAKLKITKISGNRVKKIRYAIMLKNHGRKTIQCNTNIKVKTRVINIQTNALIQEMTQFVKNGQKDLRSEHWVYMQPVLLVKVYSDLNDAKLIVDVDPDNTYHEAQRHRGNNRCVATW